MFRQINKRVKTIHTVPAPMSTRKKTHVLLAEAYMLHVHNVMWHLKLPLNMEETSPNPLIQALL